MNSAYVYVSYENDGASSPVGSIQCILGNHVKISPRVVQDYSARIFEPRDDDLLVVIGAIAFSDRIITRRRSSGWTRQIQVSVPVFDLERWQDPLILRMLEDTLYYLTGDHWSFDFRKCHIRQPQK
ncbi:MAG: hypothetical protein AAFX02_09010, partial [Pseudomonadota bacterium]